MYLIQVKSEIINETSQDASDKRYQIVFVCTELHSVWPEPHRENDGLEARSIIQKSSVCEKRYTLGSNIFFFEIWRDKVKAGYQAMSKIKALIFWTVREITRQKMLGPDQAGPGRIGARTEANF